MEAKISTKGLPRKEGLHVLKSLVGKSLSTIHLEGAIIAPSRNYKVTTFKNVALGFSDKGKDLHFLTLKSRPINVSPLLGRNHALSIEYFTYKHTPLSQRIIYPPQSLDSKFNTCIEWIDGKLIKIEALGYLYNGEIKDYPDLSRNDLFENGLNPETKVSLESIEVINLIFENSQCLYLILRNEGFEIEIGSVQRKNGIIEEYFVNHELIKTQISF